MSKIDWIVLSATVGVCWLFHSAGGGALPTLSFRPEEASSYDAQLFQRDVGLRAVDTTADDRAM